MPGTERATPFGPDTVVWKINGHMFAAYTDIGPGLSVRTTNLTRALAVIRQSRPASAPYLTGGGWVPLPWRNRARGTAAAADRKLQSGAPRLATGRPDPRGVAQDD